MTDTHFIRVEEEIYMIHKRLEAIESKCGCKVKFKEEVNKRLANLENEVLHDKADRDPKPWRVNVPVVKAEGSVTREVCTGCGEYTYDCKCAMPLSPSVQVCKCKEYEAELDEAKKLLVRWTYSQWKDFVQDKSVIRKETMKFLEGFE